MNKPRSFALKAGVVVLSTVAALAAAEFVLRHWLHAVPQLEMDIYRRDAAGNCSCGPASSVGMSPGCGTSRSASTAKAGAIRTQARRYGSGGSGPGRLDGVWLGRRARGVVSVADRGTHPPRNSRCGWSRPACREPVTSDQLRLLEMIWPRYEPRAVLLSFFVGNDFVDVQLGGAAQYDVEDGLLAHRPLGDESLGVARRGAGAARAPLAPVATAPRGAVELDTAGLQRNRHRRTIRPSAGMNGCASSPRSTARNTRSGLNAPWRRRCVVSIEMQELCREPGRTVDSGGDPARLSGVSRGTRRRCCAGWACRTTNWISTGRSVCCCAGPAERGVPAVDLLPAFRESSARSIPVSQPLLLSRRALECGRASPGGGDNLRR